MIDYETSKDVANLFYALIGKPMTISLADAEKTVAMAKEKGVRYHVIFQCRYNAASKLVKMRAEEGARGGKLGKLLCASSFLTWSRSDEYYSESDWKGTWDKEGGGVVTFKNAKKLVRTVEEIPMERILLETDCPYMAPEPHRGTRNDSRNIPYVIEKIAQIKGIDPNVVEETARENAFRLFTKAV